MKIKPVLWGASYNAWYFREFAVQTRHIVFAIWFYFTQNGIRSLRASFVPEVEFTAHPREKGAGFQPGSHLRKKLECSTNVLQKGNVPDTHNPKI